MIGSIWIVERRAGGITTAVKEKAEKSNKMVKHKFGSSKDLVKISKPYGVDLDIAPQSRNLLLALASTM